MTESVTILYTARATAAGDGRKGAVTSSDGLLDLGLALPVEMGGPGGRTNPEQLFAANLQLVAEAVTLGGQLGVESQVLLTLLQRCSGGSQGAATALRFPTTGSLGDTVGPFLRKDLAACCEVSAALGADPGLLLEVARRGPLDLAPPVSRASHPVVPDAAPDLLRTSLFDHPHATWEIP